MVEKDGLGQAFLRVLRFPLVRMIILVLHTHLHLMLMLLLSEGEAGEA
jgi:hypothetical protein